jgi:hypothetical protein
MTSVLIAVGAEHAPITVPVEQSRGRQFATTHWISPIKRRDARSPGKGRVVGPAQRAAGRRRIKRFGRVNPGLPGTGPSVVSVRLAADRGWPVFRGRISAAREGPLAAFCSGPPTTLGLASGQHRIAREGRPVARGFEHLPRTRPSPLILRYKKSSFVSVWPQARRTQKPRRPASAAQLYCAGPGLRERPLLPRRPSRLQCWRRGGLGPASAIGRHRPVSDWDRG